LVLANASVEITGRSDVEAAITALEDVQVVHGWTAEPRDLYRTSYQPFDSLRSLRAFDSRLKSLITCS
jgi:hypothetical protein